jgi:predicted transcriptional regulator
MKCVVLRTHTCYHTSSDRISHLKNTTEKKGDKLNRKRQARGFARLCHSEIGLAIPVTFLILFVSMLGVISVTYYFAIERVNADSQSLKVSMAKQAMTSLDESMLSVLWRPGSSRTMKFGDFGGQLDVQPLSNWLVVNITDNNGVADTIFNSSVGQTAYELPYSESADTGLYLKGDSRVLVNQSGLPVTQLYITNGAEHPEILLRYRLVASSTISGIEDNQAINDLRIYVVNLDASQNIELMGEVPLRISCSGVETTVRTYNVTYQSTALTIVASLDGVQGQVAIPISSDTNGAIINVQLVVCNVTIERWVR